MKFLKIAGLKDFRLHGVQNNRCALKIKQIHIIFLVEFCISMRASVSQESQKNRKGTVANINISSIWFSL